MTRHERALIYEDTKHMVGTHPVLKNAVSSSTARQEVISEADNIQIPPPRYATPVQLKVSQKRSFQAVAGYPGQKICVHNFASSCTPGGGVVHGSLAQEECLCRASTLHFCLLDDRVWIIFYLSHRQASNSFNNADCVYTPDIIVFKDDKDYHTLPEGQWFQVDVITCAAQNLHSRHIASDKLEDILLQRLRRIMAVTAINGAEVLITGAWGCGVFENTPAVVAKVMLQVAEEFKHHFKAIEFAVYSRHADDENYRAFRDAVEQHCPHY